MESEKWSEKEEFKKKPDGRIYNNMELFQG